MVKDVKLNDPLDDKVKLKKDYTPKINTQKNDLSRCPLTGKMIPNSELNKHLKIALMN